MPGLAHVFISAFVFAKVDFWWVGAKVGNQVFRCADGLVPGSPVNETLKVAFGQFLFNLLPFSECLS